MAEEMIAAEVARYQKRMYALNVVPEIVQLQKVVEEIRQTELRRLASRLQVLSTEQQTAVDTLTRSLANKFLHHPLMAIKHAAREGDVTALEAIRAAFGLQLTGRYGVGQERLEGLDHPDAPAAEPSRPGRSNEDRAASSIEDGSGGSIEDRLQGQVFLMTGAETATGAIRIGSRGSQLALWQANFIAASLHGLGHAVGIEIIHTTGDRLQQTAAPAAAGKGIFTREIEEALERGEIDLAVHSLKDLPTELSERFTLGAIPQRADPRDVLVSQRYASLEDLPSGAIVGTGSLRRQAQLRRARPDLEWIEFRGNVDTRLAKLAQGKADAIILAAAGLDRLRKAEWVRQRFSPKVLCPAAGQGALAIECRADDRKTLAAVAPLDDPETRRAVNAERRFLAALGGGCQMPIGAYAWSGSLDLDL